MPCCFVCRVQNDILSLLLLPQNTLKDYNGVIYYVIYSGGAAALHLLSYVLLWESRLICLVKNTFIVYSVWYLRCQKIK